MRGRSIYSFTNNLRAIFSQPWLDVAPSRRGTDFDVPWFLRPSWVFLHRADTFNTLLQHGRKYLVLGTRAEKSNPTSFGPSIVGITCYPTLQLPLTHSAETIIAIDAGWPTSRTGSRLWESGRTWSSSCRHAPPGPPVISIDS